MYARVCRVSLEGGLETVDLIEMNERHGLDPVHMALEIRYRILHHAVMKSTALH